ncbi:MAG TPA: hypothetical protein VGI86_05725 [Acidimicrobiia bacterium]
MVEGAWAVTDSAWGGLLIALVLAVLAQAVWGIAVDAQGNALTICNGITTTVVSWQAVEGFGWFAGRRNVLPWQSRARGCYVLYRDGRYRLLPFRQILISEQSARELTDALTQYATARGAPLLDDPDTQLRARMQH